MHSTSGAWTLHKLVLVVTLLPVESVRQGEEFAELASWFGSLPLDVPHHPAQKGPQLAGAPSGPLELLGVRVATLLMEKLLAGSNVRLPELDAVGLSLLDQPLAHTVVQPSVGGKPNVLLLHRGVDVDSLELTRLHRFQLQACLQRLTQQLLGSRLPDTSAPPGHARRING